MFPFLYSTQHTMASFQTHVAVATGGAMIASLALLGAGLINPTNMVMMVIFATLGGLLPDIDSDDSKAMNIIFQIVSGVSAFFISYVLLEYTGIAVAICLLILIHLGIRYGVLRFLSHITEHRGVIHSVPFGVLFAFALGILLYNFGGQDDLIAWLSALFLLYGFLSHLILDEISKVNLSGDSMSKSFGTAFKFISRGKSIYFLVVYVLVIGAYLLMPDWHPLKAKIFTLVAWHAIQSNLLPSSLGL